MSNKIPTPVEVFNDPQDHLDFLINPDLERLHGQYYDWKEIPNPYNKDKAQNGIIECISAFANSNMEGGMLILGIADNVTVKGIEHLSDEHSRNLLDFPNQKLRHHAVQNKTITLHGHKVVLVYIPYESRNICQTNEANPKAWKRQGSQSIPFKQEDWDYFRNLKNPGHWEMQPCIQYEERLLDMPLFEEFKSGWLAESETIHSFSIVDVLENAGAVIPHQNNWWLTNVGCLFFCSNPQRLFPSAYIRFLKYESALSDNANPGNTIGETEFRGALPTIIRKIRDWVRDSNWFRRYTYRAGDGFSFVHEDEYPIIAIGEAIVNAVVHRDYALQTPIDCATYEDAFVVKNAGGILQNQNTLPSKFTLGDVVMKSYTRNPRLVEWFRKLPDEEGKPFVRRLSEGTKRMLTEMQKLQLPMPEYMTNGETTLTFRNNIEERRKLFFNHDQPMHSDSEFLNLFKIIFQRESIESYDKVILQKEILGVIKDKLQAQKWYVDKYSKGRLVIHQQGDKIDLKNPDVEKICRIFRAFVLQVKIYDNTFYLAVDYKVVLKNIQRLHFFNLEFQQKTVGQRAIVLYEDIWMNCILKSLHDGTATVTLLDYATEVTVNKENVIPELNVLQIEESLKYHHVRFDLHTKIKEASLNLLPDASIRRAKIVSEFAQKIKEIMPIKVNGFQITLESQPTFLLNAPNVIDEKIIVPPLTVFHDLQEPQVSFSDSRKSINILDGLSKYGSYSQKEREISIIPVCTHAERENLEILIQRLQTGKYKYEGAERTFGTKFVYDTIYTVSTHNDIQAECIRLINKHPDWAGDINLSRIFLVSMPQNLYSSDDPQSPYYSIKEFLFEQGIPSQMVDTPTLYNLDYKDLNLALNIAAKCGVVPWVLSEKLPEADFFIGIAYTTSRNSGNREKLMGFASVFDEFGKWRFYKGDSVFTFDRKHEHFAKLIPETLKELGSLPENAKIHIHTASKFSQEDEKVILTAAKSVLPKAHFSFVWINDTHIIRGYDNSNVAGSLGRGTYVSLSPYKLLLSTTGYNTFRRLLGTPRLIEASIHTDGKVNLKLYAKHLLALTKLNWASTHSLTNEPITTKYALNIAYLTEKFIQRKGDFHLHKVLQKTPWFI